MYDIRNTFLGAALALAAACSGGEEQERSAAEPPFEVGSSTRFIHDFSRGYDSVAGVDTGLRILITELWYPVDRAAVAGDNTPSRRATYGDYVFGDRDMHRRMMTATTFFHLTPESVRDGVPERDIDAAIDELFARERNSYVDAPLVQGRERLPVVVMSHGDAGSRYNMETVCEHLAAHGYVVIAPEHTGNSPYSLTGRDPALAEAGGDPEIRARMAEVMPLLDAYGAYGSEDNFGQSYTPLASGRDNPEDYARMDRSLVQRVDDLRAVLDELDRMNADGPFAGRLELDGIGLMGRSYGGATTLAALVLEPRFAAGMAVVPPSMPDIRDVLPADMLVPSGRESVLLSADGPFALGEIVKPTLLLSGAEDALIIGYAALSAEGAGTQAPTPGNPHPALRAAYESTEAPVVWGLLRDSNHASFGVSGSYWWPELKPDTQARYFAPESRFTLVDAEVAHRIQKELALAFFDLVIRDDASARDRLLDKRFEAQGLILEARNM